MDEQAPSPAPEPRRATGSRARWITAVAVACVIVVAALVAIAVLTERESLPTVESLRDESPTLRDKTRLRIGVRGDLPLISQLDPETGEYSGFEIDIAKALAAELGFTEDRIEWVAIQNLPDRAGVLQRDLADMVVANFSITDAREPDVDFAGPYQVVPQAVLVRTDQATPLETIADLRAPGVRVCAPTGSTSAGALERHGILPDLVDTNSDCMTGMRSGEYDAFSTDLPILAGFSSEDTDTYEVLELAIADSNEEIGVAVPDGDEALRELIAYFLDSWRRGPDWASPWLRAYDQTIGPYMSTTYRTQPRVDYPPPPELVDYDSRVPGE